MFAIDLDDLPEVKRRINARDRDVYNLPYPRRGLYRPMQSHDSSPGTLKKKMKVKAIKRTRTAVGRLVVTPSRDDLGIPAKYPGYYPAFLEFGNATYGTAPRPYLRPVFRAKKKDIERFFTFEARKRINKVKFS